MYSTSSSDPHPQLRRAKSAPSVQKRRQYPLRLSPPDPQIAKSHAKAAASHAMLKARERSSHESSHDSGDQMQSHERTIKKALPQQRRPPNWSFAADGRPLSQISTASVPSLGSRTRNNSGEDRNAYTELSPIQEYRGLNVEDTAAPSSYRRLRRARSMLSTGHHMGSMSLRTSTNSVAQDPVNVQVMCEKPNTGSLRRSLSFFHGTGRPHLRRSYSQSAAMQLAREQYFENRDGNNQDVLPSHSKRVSRLEHRPFRKTFRPSSETDYAGLPPSIDLPGKGTVFHRKARAFSIHVKKRLKRVFGLKSSPDDQNAGNGCKPTEVSFTGSSESEREKRIEQYVISQELEYGNRAPSIRTMGSSESMATSTSRVTSWADSTAANTVATRHAPEANRLAVIQEYRDQDHLAEAHDNGDTGTSALEPNRASEPVDVRRVYSALVRKIEQEAQNEHDQAIFSGSVEPHPTVPEPVSAACSLSSRCSIRHVPSDLSIRTIRTSLLPQCQSSPIELISSPGMKTLEEPSQAHTLRTAYGTDNVFPRSPKRPIRQAESSFFPSTTLLKPKTPSPFRLAMNARLERERPPEKQAEADEGSVHSKDEDLTDSPSVYSRATDTNIWSRENLPPSANQYERKKGMATIFASQKTLYESPTRSATKPEAFNREGSKDWKGWVDSEMTKIDENPSARSRSGSGMKTGHRRENAQIVGSDHGPPYSGGHIGAEALSLISPWQDRSPLSELNASQRSNFSRPLRRRISSSTITHNKRSPTFSVSSYSYQPSEQELETSHYSDHRTNSPSHSPDSASFRSLHDQARTGSPSLSRSLRAWRRSRLSRAAMPTRSIRRTGNATDAQPIPFGHVQGRPHGGHSDPHCSSVGSNSRDASPTSLVHHNRLRDFPATISSKRMVDNFLSSRSAPEKSPEGSDLGSVFL